MTWDTSLLRRRSWLGAAPTLQVRCCHDQSRVVCCTTVHWQRQMELA